jgi:hypothetical protein
MTATALQAGRVPFVGEDLWDASRLEEGRVCAWCAGPIPGSARADAEVCGVVCRKRRWRFRRAVGTRSPGSIAQASRPPAAPRDASMRVAYADPPYPGKAGYYVERQEVDHRALIAELEAGYPDGWALSTSASALPAILPLCPPAVRVCVWRRRVRPTRSRRALSAWEPLLVVGGRELATDAPQELLDVLDYRGRYDSYPDALVGMKPPEFAVWLFRLLGARAGDELADLYPGSGAISRAWELYTSRSSPSSRPAGISMATRDGSHPTSPASRDASPAAVVARDASAAV